MKKKLSEIINFKDLNQFSIEIDPRRVKEDRLHYYSAMGADKLSFGVQDFNYDVQKNINRIQPVSLLENLLTKSVRSKFKSINFDLLVGLPGQTLSSIRSTMLEVVKLKPNRIALAYLAYNPEYHPHQRHMMTKNYYQIFMKGKNYL